MAQTGNVRKGRGCQGHQDQNAVNLSMIMPDRNMTTLGTLGLMVKVLIYGRIRKVLMVMTEQGVGHRYRMVGDQLRAAPANQC